MSKDIDKDQQVKLRVSAYCRDWWQAVAKDANLLHGGKGSISDVLELIARDPSLSTVLCAAIALKTEKENPD